MNLPDTPPKPAPNEQPRPEGLNETVCPTFVFRDDRGWPFMVAPRNGVLWKHYWQRNTNTWSPVSPVKTIQELKDLQELAMSADDQATYLPNNENPKNGQ
jgi:hypothetical protein